MREGDLAAVRVVRVERRTLTCASLRYFHRLYNITLFVLTIAAKSLKMYINSRR